MVGASATVADVLWLESLSWEDRERLKRLYPESDDGGVGEAALEKAYEAGFEAGAEEVEIERPFYSRRHFERWQKNRKAT